MFRAPRSFTREDVVEISCHGSDYVVRQVLALLLRQGARLAEAGEFTKRAFLHGALDLAQAEAVADLIAADSALSPPRGPEPAAGRLLAGAARRCGPG